MLKKLFLSIFVCTLSLYASKAHVLTCSPAGSCQIIIHYTSPTGSNSAGATWSSILSTTQAEGSKFLPVGNGTAEITAAENNQLIGGNLKEISFSTSGCGFDPSDACFQEVVDGQISTDEFNFKSRFKLFGKLLE